MCVLNKHYVNELFGQRTFDPIVLSGSDHSAFVYIPKLEQREINVLSLAESFSFRFCFLNTFTSRQVAAEVKKENYDESVIKFLGQIYLQFNVFAYRAVFSWLISNIIIDLHI